MAKEFTLDEALAVRHFVSRMGYPTKNDVAALRAANVIIRESAVKAIERFGKANEKAPPGRG